MAKFRLPPQILGVPKVWEALAPRMPRRPSGTTGVHSRVEGGEMWGELRQRLGRAGLVRNSGGCQTVSWGAGTPGTSRACQTSPCAGASAGAPGTAGTSAGLRGLWRGEALSETLTHTDISLLPVCVVARPGREEGRQGWEGGKEGGQSLVSSFSPTRCVTVGKMPHLSEPRCLRL